MSENRTAAVGVTAVCFWALFVSTACGGGASGGGGSDGGDVRRDGGFDASWDGAQGDGGGLTDSGPVDHCADSPCDPLHGTCMNTEGSYECSCEPGWQLDSDGVTCIDIDECADAPCDPVHGVCTNTEGSYECGCESGWQLGSHDVTCIDIDECADSPCDPLHGTCTNTEGGYECSCDDQWRLAEDGVTCVDVCQRVDLGLRQYLFCDWPLSWSEAEDYCQNRGGYRLVAVEDAFENAWLSERYGRYLSAQPWIGLSDQAQEGQWIWMGGATSSFRDWSAGEPNGGANEDCVMSYWSGQWNDSSCQYARPFVCERGCDRPVVWEQNGHAYWNCSFDANFDEAEAHCEALGGHLATAGNVEELNFFNSLSADPTPHWLGATDAANEGYWDWLDGGMWVPCWRQGEPNNVGNEDCMTYVPASSSSETCNDVPCDSRHPFVCEADVVCDQPRVDGAGSMHRYCGSSLTWNDARAYCEGILMELAVPGESSENDWLAGLSGGPESRVWIGGVEGPDEGDWRWIDGTSWDYENWDGSQPDDGGGVEDCIEMTRADYAGWRFGGWNDASCAITRPFLCEFAFHSITDKHILFAHGLGANSGEWSYYVPWAEDRGFTTHVTSLPDSCAALSDRADALARFINSLPFVPDHHLVTVGHSMGGLDLRYIISFGARGVEPFRSAARRIANISTLATPHQGQDSAETFGSFDPGDLGLFFPGCTGKPAMTSLSNASMSAFNQAYPYATAFTVDNVRVPLLAYSFLCNHDGCSCLGEYWCGARWWKTDCLVGTANQRWAGAPAYPTELYGRHSRDLAGGYGLPCDSETGAAHTSDVLDLILHDWAIYPSSPLDNRVVILRVNPSVPDAAESVFSQATTSLIFLEALSADDSREMIFDALRLLSTGDGHWVLRRVGGGDDAMCVPATADANSHNLDDLQPCTGGADQQWSLVPAAPGSYQLVSRNSSACLTRVGTVAKLETCGSGQDEFQLVATQDRWLSLRAPDGKALTFSLDPNSPQAFTSDFSGGTAQVYLISPSQGHGLDFQIRVAHPSLNHACLNVEQQSLLDSCSGRQDPRVRFIPIGDGSYLIKNPVTGHCLVSTPGGGPVFQSGCDVSLVWQHWTMAPLGKP